MGTKTLLTEADEENCTVPVRAGPPAALGATCAMRVTLVPDLIAALEVVTVVVVARSETVSLILTLAVW